MAPVLMMLRAIFVAVPAFNRVDPAMISGPVANLTARSTLMLALWFGLHVSKIVLAPTARARLSAPSTNGVRPLAEIPMTRSRPLTSRSSIARAPFLSSSSAASMLRRNALLPPAMIPWIKSDGVPKVGGISAASSTPKRPLVPAPT